jgi:hypothetical protein
MATRWERNHTNGWRATVETTADGFYKASAHQPTVVSAQWVQQGIVDLALAQELADRRVDAHVYSCPGWVVRE